MSENNLLFIYSVHLVCICDAKKFQFKILAKTPEQKMSNHIVNSTLFTLG
jgi:hypothetical protein